MGSRMIPVLAAVTLLPLGAAPFAAPDPAPAFDAASAEEYGVYISLAERVSGDFDSAVATLSGAFEAAGWQVLASHESGVDSDVCSYRAAVLAVNSPEYSTSVLQMGALAAFALPLRVAVFQDENGTHVAAANPLSLNRTIISENAFDAQSRAVVGQLRAVAESAFPGKAGNQQYGQMRDRGLISRTMGLIAGGAFTSKIETVTRVRPEDGEGLSEVAQRIYEGIAGVGGSWSWDIRPVYLLDMASEGAVVIGLTGARMEEKAFQIVGSGGNSTRKDLACPGIDHAAAFPI